MSHEALAGLDVNLAHRHFSVDCFNRTWTLIESDRRTADDMEAMVLCALASLWHWAQRADCTAQNLSMGHWQVARVYALAGQGENAMQHGQRALHFANGGAPFYVGYAHEAMARAAMVAKDRVGFLDHMSQARTYAAEVADPKERQLLNDDLQSLELSWDAR